MRTDFCDLLGIEHPIVAASMGPDLTGPEFVAAVSNAGGLGILQAQFCPPPVFREEIRRVRALTAKPFGVNLILHFPVEDQVAVCLDERVPVLSLFWGDPTPYAARAHGAGVKVFHQVARSRTPASTRGRRRSSGQIYRAVTIPHAMRLNAMLTKNQIICCGTIMSPL